MANARSEGLRKLLGMDAREIIRQIEALPSKDRQQIVRWLWTRVEESPEMLEFFDEGIRSVEQKPLILLKKSAENRKVGYRIEFSSRAEGDLESVVRFLARRAALGCQTRSGIVG
jgi:hypothetical protein